MVASPSERKILVWEENLKQTRKTTTKTQSNGLRSVRVYQILEIELLLLILQIP